MNQAPPKNSSPLTMNLVSLEEMKTSNMHLACKKGDLKYALTLIKKWFLFPNQLLFFF